MGEDLFRIRTGVVIKVLIVGIVTFVIVFFISIIISNNKPVEPLKHALMRPEPPEVETPKAPRTIMLTPGEKLVDISWKESSLYYTTRKMREAEFAEIYTVTTKVKYFGEESEKIVIIELPQD